MAHARERLGRSHSLARVSSQSKQTTCARVRCTYGMCECDEHGRVGELREISQTDKKHAALCRRAQSASRVSQNACIAHATRPIFPHSSLSPRAATAADFYSAKLPLSDASILRQMIFTSDKRVAGFTAAFVACKAILFCVCHTCWSESSFEYFPFGRRCDEKLLS